ncbi:Fe-S cluster assembly protein SufD, partial [Thioclava sp. BHET1]
MMALSEAKAQATEARLALLPEPQGAAWLQLARGTALSRLTAIGLPGRRDEYWKYTNPADLISAEVPAAVAYDAAGEPV